MIENVKNVSLVNKLMGGFAVLVLIMASVIAMTYRATRHVKDKAVSTKNQNAVFAGIARQMKFDTIQVQQWLTDISATRGLDGLDDGYEEAEKSRQSFLAGLGKFKELYQKEGNSAGLQKLEEMESAFEAYYETGKEMAAGYIAEGPTSGNKLMGEFDETAEKIANSLNPFVESQTDELNNAMKAVISNAEGLMLGSVVGGIVAVLAGILVACLISRSISGALRNTFRGLKRFSTNELETLGRTIRQIIKGLSNGAEQTASAAGQVSSASQSLAQGSSEQAASIEETSSSIEEMASMTRRNAGNANEAKSLADNATEAMSRMSQGIDDIKKSSDETAKVVKTIDEIAFQTNLLALNAAIEAARAGEVGKGFAVVAEEVRNLAQRSAEAARNTAEMIEGSVKNADNGVTITKEIAESNRKINNLVAEIAAASNEQAQGIEQINAAMGQMDQATQSNAANAEESASAAEELSSQAEELSNAVRQLQAMVGGLAAGGSVRCRKPRIRRNVWMDSFKSESGTSSSESAFRSGKSAAPEEMIPMDNKEKLSKV